MSISRAPFPLPEVANVLAGVKAEPCGWRSASLDAGSGRQGRQLSGTTQGTTHADVGDETSTTSQTPADSTRTGRAGPGR
jgi:hypothetical protein